MGKLSTPIIFGAIAILGAVSLGIIALHQGESISAVWMVVAAVCTYAIAYRFYSRYLANKVMGLNPARLTPAMRRNDGLDYVPTPRNVLFGHHFAAIAGAGPLVGPVLAAQMGYLPGVLWILVGAVLAGAVQDMMVLFMSTRRDGKSLGDMIRTEMGNIPGIIAQVGVLMIMVIILAVLALVVVKALAESPWGTFTVAATIPIAIFMGLYTRFLRPGRVGEVSVIGVVLLILAIIGGGHVAADPYWGPAFTLTGPTLAILMMVYGFIASVIPVWLLLAPRDYLSTFLKIGAIVALAVGILIVRPHLQMPAITPFIDGTGPVFAGALFPFLFITIACGAVSGFHALISSGTTPKLLENEAQIPMIGYGAMLCESFVAVMALIAATVLDPAVYFAMNSPAAVIGKDAASAAAAVAQWGFHITPGELEQLARDVGEHSILSRAGGAPTLAVGMAHILSSVIGGKAMMAFWYHFAILFEALFILTTVDAGTRVCRFMIQDLLGVAGSEDARDQVLGRQRRGHGPDGRPVGLFPLYRRGRSAGRHQQPVAPVRHRQPDAGGGRPDPGDRGPVQDEAREVRLGHGGASDLAADLHPDGGLPEAVPPRGPHRLPGPCAEVSGGAGRRRTDRPGQVGGGHAPDRGQRLRQLGSDGGLPVRGHHHGRLWRPGLPQGLSQQPSDRARISRKSRSDGGRRSRGRGPCLTPRTRTCCACAATPPCGGVAASGARPAP